MFGTYRYALATLVVATHLAGFRGAGSYAVFGFYILSGYLMTAVLNDRYGFSAHGIGAFLANRALRIYPPYWVVLLGATALVALNPEFMREFHQAIQLPSQPAAIMENTFIFGLAWNAPSRLIPPTWSLYTELVFYLLMAAGLSRRRWIAWAWFLASVIYTAILLSSQPDWRARYFPVLAASLPFSVGALIYFNREFLRTLPKSLPLILGPIFLANALLSFWIWGDTAMRTWGLYASVILAILTQASLVHAPKKRIPASIRQADRLLGDIAYPVFLCHYHVGAAIMMLFVAGGSHARFSGAGLLTKVAWFAVSFVSVNLVALLVHRMVENPVNRLRNRIRQAGASSSDELTSELTVSKA